MNNRKILEDVYKDFFNEDILDKKTVNDSDVNVKSIDDLYIDDESKNLLKKIIKYMEDYFKGVEKRYLTFNICIETDDNSVVSDISDILRYNAFKYNYVDIKSFFDLSFYKLDKEDSINSYYKDNGIILLSDLDALKLKDVSFLKKFFYNFFLNINSNKITIINGKKNKVNDFILEDDRLKDYFSFVLVGIKPDVNDVYNSVISNISLGDDFNIKLLDYISNTYANSSDSYSDYVSNLCKYIAFNKSVPPISAVKSIDDVFSELNELVGLDNVKKALYDLVDLISLKNKTKDDLKINNVNLHMVFLGNPGTGKTTVARLVGDILYSLGYIKQNKLIEVSSKDLVAEYVGQTAVKTMNVINKAMGGILFIDEAYALSSKGNDNSYNGECIATLIKAMEDYRDSLVVIFAGYTKEMQNFLDSNSGIVSRIGYTLEFNDYTNDELKQIFSGMVTKAGFILEDDALVEVERLINENRNMKNFGNARFVRNIYEKSVIKHATNTKNSKNKKVLKTIIKKDITL